MGNMYLEPHRYGRKGDGEIVPKIVENELDGSARGIVSEERR